MRDGTARAAGTPRVLDGRQARAVALDLLSRKGWTRRELAARLRRRGAAAAVAEAVVADLEALGYVDDRAFAAAWAEARARSRGSRRLGEELARKGISRPHAAAAIAAAFAESDEVTRARALAARRMAVAGRAAPDRSARRLYDYLVRRGYPIAVARQVVRETCRTAIGPDDE